MKKLVLFGSALIVAFACSKEKMESPKEGPPMLKSSVNPNNYEIYDYPANYEEVLEDYLSLIEAGENVGNQSIQEAVWILEAGLNFVYADEMLTFDGVAKEIVSYEFDLDGSSQLNGQDITTTFLANYWEVEEYVSEEEVFLTADVIVTDVSGSAISMDIHLIYAQNPVAVVASGPYGGLPAVDAREAGTDQYCQGNSGSTGDGPTYKYNADQTMKGYNQGHAFKWGTSGNKGFHQNVLYYGSLNSYNTLSADKLFGNPGSVVPAHDTFSPKTTCLSEGDQDEYIQAMWEDLSGLAFGRDHKVLSIVVDDYEYPFQPGSISWYYDDVKIGEWAHNLTGNFTFEPEI